MRRVQQRLTYANVMATVAVFLGLGGGAYAAVSSIPGPDGVIHGCYAKRNGNLRVVLPGTRCSKREKAITFNKEGPRGAGVRGSTGSRGIQGIPGTAGTPGVTGERGPQGPGATSFVTTVGQTGVWEHLATIEGVAVSGLCTSSTVGFEFKAAEGGGLQTSGTGSQGTAMYPFNNDFGVSSVAQSNAGEMDFDIVARGTSASKFARIDVHGSHGTTCRFWGMLTPSS